MSVVEHLERTVLSDVLRLAPVLPRSAVNVVPLLSQLPKVRDGDGEGRF